MIEIPPEDKVLTPAEAAAVLGMKPKDLHPLETGGELTGTRTIGGHRRYYEWSVLELRDKRAAAAAAPRRPPPERKLTSGQAAALLGVARKKVTQWVHDKKIGGEWTAGHRLKIPASEVERLLTERTREP